MSLLCSLAIIFLSSLLLGSILKKIRIPPLVGMLIVGIVFGPYVLNLISPNLLNVSSDLRQLALIIILTRAGLSLKLSDLKKVGRPAILLCFLPATFEIVGYICFAPLFLHISYVESALLGAVMGAVSPAVVVPRMLKLQEQRYGTNKAIPQMIVAGSSCDDVYVIVLFTALLATVSGGNFDLNIIWEIPVSILLGIIVGIAIGYLLSWFFQKFHIRDTIKIIVLLSLSFLLVTLENWIKSYVPFSGLLAIISLGIMFNRNDEMRANRLAIRYNKLWVFAEILLFVLVGAEVDISYAFSSSGFIVLVIFLSLLFRSVGVFLSLAKTKLSFKERCFVVIAYLPKATVQAAIGAIPLSVGLNCGPLILTCAVLAILITAPLGAFSIDLTYKKLLEKETTEDEKQVNSPT